MILTLYLLCLLSFSAPFLFLWDEIALVTRLPFGPLVMWVMLNQSSGDGHMAAVETKLEAELPAVAKLHHLYVLIDFQDLVI